MSPRKLEKPGKGVHLRKDQGYLLEDLQIIRFFLLKYKPIFLRALKVFENFMVYLLKFEAVEIYLWAACDAFPIRHQEWEALCCELN